MNNKQIIKSIQSEKYNFLRTDNNLKENVILLTVGGSHAYGTENENSDLDIRGIAIENKNCILGLSNFEQFEDKITDTVIYGLKKYINLISNCNPNTIEILGTKKEQIYYINEIGQLLKDNINLFLSKRAVHSFGGYAIAQLRRLENALVRDEYPQAEKEQHILKTIQGQMYHFIDHYKDLTGQTINLYIDKSNKEDYETEIFMDLDLKNYPLRDFKNIYSEMNNIVSEYGKLNHRNNKKDEIHLNKHAMHLIRLYLMGIDILEGNGVNTYRENDRELLLNIRNGKYEYKEIFEMANSYKNRFEYASKNTSLPSQPNYKLIEELVIDMYEKYLKR